MGRSGRETFRNITAENRKGIDSAKKTLRSPGNHALVLIAVRSVLARGRPDLLEAPAAIPKRGTIRFPSVRLPFQACCVRRVGPLYSRICKDCTRIHGAPPSVARSRTYPMPSHGVVRPEST